MDFRFLWVGCGIWDAFDFPLFWSICTRFELFGQRKSDSSSTAWHLSCPLLSLIPQFRMVSTHVFVHVFCMVSTHSCMYVLCCVDLCPLAQPSSAFFYCTFCSLVRPNTSTWTPSLNQRYWTALCMSYLWPCSLQHSPLITKWVFDSVTFLCELPFPSLTSCGEHAGLPVYGASRGQ